MYLLTGRSLKLTRFAQSGVELPVAIYGSHWHCAAGPQHPGIDIMQLWR